LIYAKGGTIRLDGPVVVIPQKILVPGVFLEEHLEIVVAILGSVLDLLVPALWVTECAHNIVASG
jgi:hypothetical protein